MPTLQQNPFLLNIVHSNSAHSSSSFRVNFMNSGSILQNPSQNYRPSSPNRGIQHRRSSTKVTTKANRKLIARASEEDENASAGGRSFLSFEEAGLVEMSGLSTHERFLCRLTISSLNLLRVVAEQEGCEIEELNAGKICDWFLKDRLKREQNIGSAVLQWEDDDDGLQF